MAIFVKRRPYLTGAAGAFCRAAARAFTATSAMAQEASLEFFWMGRKGYALDFIHFHPPTWGVHHQNHQQKT
jgi:hypothetical protein